MQHVNSFWLNTNSNCDKSKRLEGAVYLFTNDMKQKHEIGTNQFAYQTCRIVLTNYSASIFMVYDVFTTRDISNGPIPKKEKFSKNHSDNLKYPFIESI